MREIWFVAVVAILAGAGFARPVAAAQTVRPILADASSKQGILKIQKDDRILGKRDAPITIIEYASMSCPHCAHFQNDILPTIKKQWIDTGKAKLILRDFPLDEPALRAAMIARCAPPDRFYAFADAFFADQAQWVLAPDYKKALARLAKLGGMSTEKAASCLKDTALENKIVQERLTASKDLGVNSTPTFFVNGREFTGAPTIAEFDKFLSSVAPKA